MLVDQEGFQHDINIRDKSQKKEHFSLLLLPDCGILFKMLGMEFPKTAFGLMTPTVSRDTVGVFYFPPFFHPSLWVHVSSVRQHTNNSVFTEVSMATAESTTTLSTLPGTSLDRSAGSVSRYLRSLDAALSDGDLALPRESERIRELENRLFEGRFHLAVLGQFKRGKSSLLNALMGEPLLPVSVVPLTAVPTFVRWGETPSIRIEREGGNAEEFAGGTVEDRRDFLTRYVTEENNPKNRLGVCGVEVFLPSPLLEKGVVLIDTPGIGSVYRHNTEATLNFLPQCDAALFWFRQTHP